MRPRRRLMGRDGRSSLPSAASPGVRPMSTRTSTPSSPRSGRSPASAALFLLGSAPPDTPRPKKGYLFAPSSPTLNVRTFRETGNGDGMPVAGLVAARERRPDGQADGRESTQWLWPLLAPVGLALVVAGGESWADSAIVSPNGLPVQVHPTFPEPGLPAANFPQGGLSDAGGVAGAVTVPGGSDSGPTTDSN